MRRAGRKSLAAGVVALSLVLMGTGYAYWTDTLNITTNATTGDLDVTFADLGLYAQYTNEAPGGWSIIDGVGDGYVGDHFFIEKNNNYNEIADQSAIDAYHKAAKGYNNVSFDAELVDKAPIVKVVGPYNGNNTDGSDQIKITVDQMYPGYAQAFRTDILNVGSIAARLSDMKFLADGDNYEMMNMLGLALYIDKEAYVFDKADNGKETFKLCEALADGDNFFTIGEVDFLRLSALEDVDVKEALANHVLMCAPDSDNRMDLFLAIAMDPDMEGHFTTGYTGDMKDNDDSLSQNGTAVLYIDLLWDQFNVGKDTGKGNILMNQNKK